MILTRAGEGWLRGLYWGIRAGGLTGRLATAGGAAPSGMMAVEQDSSIAAAATMAPPLNIFCIGPDFGTDFVPRTGKSASLLTHHFVSRTRVTSQLPPCVQIGSASWRDRGCKNVYTS